MLKYSSIHVYVFAVFLGIMAFNCKKVVTVDPPVTSTNGEIIFEDDNSAISVMNGIYTQMSLGGTYATGNSSISLRAGLSADELTLYSGVTNYSLSNYFTNSLQANSLMPSGSESWRTFYNQIYVCNSVLEGISQSANLNPNVKRQLLGEAKFMRAFCYFYLTNLFGDVPLALTTDYKTNMLLPRTESSKVTDQMVLDLKDAQLLLTTGYVDALLINSTTERIRPNKWAATALLARVLLFKNDWTNAEIEATSVINNSGLYSLDTLNGVFLKNSKESIWQLQPVRLGRNTEDAFTFIIPSSGPSDINGMNGNPVYLSGFLLNTFENNDKRKLNWTKSVTINPGAVTYTFPFKYKNTNVVSSVTEYLTVLRLAEQYLIRAEARAHLGKISESLQDINIIRNRAGLPPTTATDVNSLLTAALRERQVEFFTEWGHRWMDLRRTGQIDLVMNMVAPLKNGVWESEDQLYPILQADIDANPNLTQNQGY